MKNIQNGFHRIAILLITSMSFFLLITQTIADWKAYRQNLEQLNLIEYTCVPEETALTGWHFEKIKYQEAINAGYSDKEIVFHLSYKYSDFDLNGFTENAQTIKERTFIKTVIASLFYYSLVAACLYLTVLFCGFCIRWIAKGFKPNQ